MMIARKLLLVVSFFSLGLFASAASAASVTVCDTACDYTTITDAVTLGTFNPGDSIFVGLDYASTTETFPINIPTGVNLDCQNSGAVIGVDDEHSQVNIHPQSDNIFRDCRYSNVSITSNNQSNIQILDNIFFENSRLSTNNVSDITATGNLGLRNVSIGNTVGAIIDSNTIDSLAYIWGDALQITNSTSVQFTRNTITDSVTSTPTGDQIIGIGGDSFDIYFASNTVSMPYSTFSGGGLSMLEIANSRGITVRDNLFSMSGNGGGIQVLNFNGSGGDIAVDAEHNTIKLNDPCSGCSGILMSSWNVADVSVTSSYNLIAASSPSSTAFMQGHSSYGAGPSSSLHLFTDHEGFAGLNVLDTPDFPASSNAIILRNTPFRLGNATTSDDLSLVPYSAFLDVNGAEDIGAAPGVRGNVFHLNATGVIDYSSVDATTTDPVMESLRNADTVHVANGSYGPMQINHIASSPVALTGGISIFGAGAGTIIQATSTGGALMINGVDGSNFSNLTFTGATGSAIIPSYVMTHTLFTYNLNTYDQTGFIFAPDLALIVQNSACSLIFSSADGASVTVGVGNASHDWNVGLVDVLGNKVTIWIPSDVVNSGPALDAFLSGTCGSPPGTVTDRFINSAIVANGNGTFSYNPTAVASAGAAVKIGETLPPAITRSTSVGTGGGINLVDASNNIFTNVTSTANTFGLRFIGSANGNRLVNSTINGQNSYDIYSSSTGYNELINTLFTAASSSLSGSGTIRASFSARAFVQDTGATPVATPVTVTSANAASSTLLTTDSSGFSAFSLPLPAFTLTSLSSLETSGGFNPYGFTIDSIGQYLASTTHATLDMPFQTVSLAVLIGLQVQNTGGGGIGSVPPPHGFSTTGYSINPLDVASMQKLGYVFHELVKLPDDRNPATQDDSTVYYLGIDGRRHVFPNPSVYFSWYCDYSSVRIISGADLAKIPLGRNVEYRPGLRLVKFPSVATVYLVQTGGVLRPIPDEATAAQLIGSDWNRHVSDISVAFYSDYVIDGNSISPFDFQSLNQSPSTISGNLNFDGYVEPPLTNVPQCTASASAIAPLIVAARTQASWPFIQIPKGFNFVNALGQTTGSAKEIRYLQEILRFLGPSIYPEAKITGNYGSATTAAVKKFQVAHGLAQTGMVGVATRNALNVTMDSYR